MFEAREATALFLCMRRCPAARPLRLSGERRKKEAWESMPSPPGHVGLPQSDEVVESTKNTGISTSCEKTKGVRNADSPMV